MLSKNHGRALWIEEFAEDSVYCQDSCMEKLGCLNCKSENHETIDCILPSRFVFKHGNGVCPRKMVLLKLRCNTVSNPRHMLPYDYPIKGTILHVNHKESCLYVRPQNLDEICNALDNFLFEIRQTILCPATPNKINIGDVYLIRRQGSNVLARGVCAHMYFNWQTATQWQMYLIDIGQIEFVDQRSIYLLPGQLYSMPPMAVPLVLTNCRVGYERSVSCNIDHFSMLNIGSTCIFSLSSSYQGQSLSLSKNGYYPKFINSRYPPPLLARIFGGTSLRDEIFCKRGLSDITSLSHPIYPLYCPSTFSFKKFTLENPFPVTLTVQVTEKIDESHYWLRDASICSIISKQIILPSNGLWPYIEEKRSLACIAHIQRPIRKQSRYYRAVASNFDNQKCCCTVFLIDYGQTLYCDVHHLFDLTDQPPIVLYSYAAAFKCAVNRKNSIESEIHAAKLAMDERYILQIIGKEDETSYIATVDMYIQADFQYPRNLNHSNDIIINNSQSLMLGYNNEISRSNEILDNNNNNNNFNNNISYHYDDNNWMMKMRAIFPTIGMQMSANQGIENSVKALDVKVSIKLAQISGRIDELYNAFRSLQLANDNQNLLRFLQTHQYNNSTTTTTTTNNNNNNNNTQRASKDRMHDQATSFAAGDGKDMICYGTNYQSLPLLGQTAFSRFQTVTNPKQYIHHHHQQQQQQQQQQSNIVMPSGRCYSHGIENHKCAFANHPPQSHQQSHIYTNHINQSVQRNTIDFTQQFCQQSRQQRAMIAAGCVICSKQQQQQRDHENQTLKSCCFCGAYIETKQRSFITSNNTSFQHSTMSRLNATHLQSFTYTSPDNLHGTSTISGNSSSMIVSSFKNSNTPSNADSQLSSLSDSPTNDFQFSNRNDAQQQSSVSCFEFGENTTSTKEETQIMMINHKSNSTLLSINAKNDTSTSQSNVNSQTENDSSNVESVKISHEAQNQNMPESCWICGKVGHLTRYCQPTPPTHLFLAQEIKMEQQKKTTDKPRDEKGRVLYTSDESSDDELNYLTMNSDSDQEVKQIKNIPSLDYDIKLLSDDDNDNDDANVEKDDLTIALKYKAYFSHVNVRFGHRYMVSRSDEDIASSLWPLFFVQIQSTEFQQMLEAHLDSLIANTRLANTEMVIGTLCVAYCERFDAKFRAVITAICGNLVEIFYIDYGNYEWVQDSTLWSITDQDKTTITHPGMAIPCILKAYEQEEIASCLSPNDIVKMKLAVNCSQWGFYLTFRKQRSDGVCVVELDEEARMD